MAKRVTNEDIIRINKIYSATKVYAETARQTGFSASTVKKYVNPGFKILDKPMEKIEFNHMAFPPFPQKGQEWRELMVLTDSERKRILDLQKEVMI